MKKPTLFLTKSVHDFVSLAWRQTVSGQAVGCGDLPVNRLGGRDIPEIKYFLEGNKIKNSPLQVGEAW